MDTCIHHSPGATINPRCQILAFIRFLLKAVVDYVRNFEIHATKRLAGSVKSLGGANRPRKPSGSQNPLVSAADRRRGELRFSCDLKAKTEKASQALVAANNPC